VNSLFVMKLQQLRLINIHDKKSIKRDICVKSKITKKPFHSVEHQIGHLVLINIDLANLKQTMSKGGKNYFVTFIDDYFIYTKV